MPRLLRRISPRKPAAAQHTVQIDRSRSSSGQRGRAFLRFDPAAEGSAGAQAEPSTVSCSSAAPVESIEELLLADAWACLATVGSEQELSGHSSPKQTASEARPRPSRDNRPSVARVTGAGTGDANIAPQPTPAAARPRTARVQLRLSQATVQILQAFRKAGKHPSAIVEKALWRDAAIRDAAAILLVDCDSD